MSRLDTSKLLLGEIILKDKNWKWVGGNHVILKFQEAGKVQEGQTIGFGPYTLKVIQQEHNGWLCKRI